MPAERGRWYCYELMVKVNTPGERDGRVAFWVDGKLSGDFPSLRFRSTPLLQANRINLVTYASSLRPNTTTWWRRRSTSVPRSPAEAGGATCSP